MSQVIQPIVIANTPRAWKLWHEADTLVEQLDDGPQYARARADLDQIRTWLSDLSHLGWSHSDTLTVSIFCEMDVDNALFTELRRLCAKVEHALWVDRQERRQRQLAERAECERMFKLQARATLAEASKPKAKRVMRFGDYRPPALKGMMAGYVPTIRCAARCSMPSAWRRRGTADTQGGPDAVHRQQPPHGQAWDRTRPARASHREGSHA